MQQQSMTNYTMTVLFLLVQKVKFCFIPASKLMKKCFIFTLQNRPEPLDAWSEVA